MAPKIAEKRIDMPMIPGYMNWMYEMPVPRPNALPSDELKPDPKTSRNSSGWASDATSRQRSRQ